MVPSVPLHLSLQLRLKPLYFRFHLRLTSLLLYPPPSQVTVLGILTLPVVMTSDSSLFTSTTELPHPPTIYAINGSHLHVSHSGSISTPQTFVTDTIFVPKLSLI